MDRVEKLDRGDGVQLAFQHLHGRSPTVVFCPGYNSDMSGSKATELADFCAARGQAFLRFDYSGHGASGGKFTDGTISVWLADALAMIDQVLGDAGMILVGSSMGGWISLLASLARRDRVVGLIGIAAAPDFTEALMWDAMSFAERRTLMETGHIVVPNPYGDRYPVTSALIEDGRRHLLLNTPIELTCPVRLLHGQADADVPWEISARIAEQITATDVHLILVKDGDHRLSRPADLALLRDTLAALLRENGA